MRDQRWNVDEMGKKWAIYRKKSWAKIAVGILFYRCKTKLVVGLKSGQILTIGSSYNCWGSILAIGSHTNSIWTIRCTWNWLLEIEPDLNCLINARKLGAIRSEDQESRWRHPIRPDLDRQINIGKQMEVPIFFQKINDTNQNFVDKLQHLAIFFCRFHQFFAWSRIFADFNLNLAKFLLSTFRSPLLYH